MAGSVAIFNISNVLYDSANQEYLNDILHRCAGSTVNISISLLHFLFDKEVKIIHLRFQSA